MLLLCGPCLVGEKTRENALLGIEGFWFFLSSLMIFWQQMDCRKWFFFFIVMFTVVLVLNNGFYVTQHNCMVQLISVDSRSLISSFCFLHFWQYKQAEHFKKKEENHVSIKLLCLMTENLWWGVDDMKEFEL